MHHRSLRLGLAVALLGGAACRTPDPPPEGARAADSGGSSELIGPVVDPNVVALAPAPTPVPVPAPAAAPAPARAEGWNVEHIDWQPDEAGLKRAKALEKPG